MLPLASMPQRRTKLWPAPQIGRWFVLEGLGRQFTLELESTLSPRRSSVAPRCTENEFHLDALDAGRY